MAVWGEDGGPRAAVGPAAPGVSSETGGPGVAAANGGGGESGLAATNQQADGAVAANGEADGAGALALREGETSYSFSGMMASRRRWLRWEVAVTLAAAAGGAAAGYWAAPAYLRHPTWAGDRAAFMGVVALGLVTIVGVVICCAEAWPVPAYGPRPRPRPLPLWLALLRLAGCWLLTLPFSLICLLGAGVGIDAAVGGAWGRAAVWLAIGLAFGAAGAFLLAGSQVAAGTGLKPGGKVPDAVRRSRWWRHVLWMLALWATLLSGLAVSFGIQGHWGDFADTLTTALGSWVALAVAASGELPEDAFGG